MNCNLSKQDRDNGMRCRSWDCQPCKEYVSEHDKKIIDSHIVHLKKRATAWDDLKQESEKLKAEIEELKNHPAVNTLLDKENKTLRELVKEAISLQDWMKYDDKEQNEWLEKAKGILG